MNWEIVSATGDWIGAFVVVATLFYLAKQIQQQNRVARYTALKDLLDEINHANALQAQDAQIRSVYGRGLTNPQSLSDEEAAQFSWIFRLYFNQMIKFQRAYVTGLIDEQDWADFATHFSLVLFSPGGSAWLESQGDILKDVTAAYREHYKEGADGLADYTLGRE
jgi:hypothetical protein